MCRGLAILVDKHGRIICKGMSSHTKTAKHHAIEDTSLKYEVIVTDTNKQGYKIEIDDNHKNDKEHKAMLPEVKKWVKDNEKEVLRYLLHCQSYAERKGDTDNSCQETKGNTYNSYQKTGGDTNNSWQKTSGDTNNSCQETGGDTNNSFQKTKGNTYNTWQETGGNTNNSYQKTGGEWYCGRIKLKKYPNNTKLIKTIKDSWNLTIVELISWVANHPEETKKIMGKELVKA